MKYLLTIFAISLLLTSCDFIAPDDPEFELTKKSIEVVSTNNNFGLELLNKVLESEDTANVMISPASISLALGMTYNGAETTTKEAFDNILNYEGLTREEVNLISRNLIELLVTDSKGNLVEIANSIWYREAFQVYQNFLDINASYFDATVKEIDFNAPEAVDMINQWVSDNTHEKIETIIEKIEPSTVMFLINALYFNCVWEYEFDPDETTELMFYNDDNTEFGEVTMMKTQSTFKCAFNDDFTAVELPYKNEKFSMKLFCPTLKTSLDDLIEKLDGNTWNSWSEDLTEQENVKVFLPKFKFDYMRSLKPDLMDMGLEIAFTGGADFSGISESPLFISDVIHKTYIDCNEEGTEAAAVTAVVMDWSSSTTPPMAIFNRPFLFAITENSSNSLLFIGKVSEPE